MNRFQLQDKLYHFPYHYLPHLDERGRPLLYASLDWGLHYLAYMQHIVGHIRRLQPASLLDVGCGDGRLLSMIGTEVPRRVGIDLSEQGIAFARAFVPEVEFIVGDLADLTEKFDVVACVETLEHIPDMVMKNFVAALHARLQPQGRLVVSVPGAVRPVTLKHYRHYTAQLLTEQLSSHFQLLEIAHLVRHGPLSRMLSRALVNRWVIVTAAPWRKLVWSIYRRRCVLAPDNRGEHIVAVFAQR